VMAGELHPHQRRPGLLLMRPHHHQQWLLTLDVQTRTAQALELSKSRNERDQTDWEVTASSTCHLSVLYLIFKYDYINFSLS
jgi:hypothetical protein